MENSADIFEVSAAEFDDRVLAESRNRPVLVDFWADWCGPCRMLMPVLSQLVENYAGKVALAKVNTDAEQELATRFAVRSLPTVKLFIDGEVVDEFMGAQPDSVIRSMLDRHVARESDQVRSEAQTLLEQGDTGQARALLEKAREEDPENHRVTLDLLRVLIESGEAEGAEDLIRELPVEQRTSDDVERLRTRISLAKVVQGMPDAEEAEKKLQSSPDNVALRHQYAVHQVLSGQKEEGLESLLSLVRTAKDFEDGAPRKSLLAAFDLLSDDEELVSRYRKKMAALLY